MLGAGVLAALLIAGYLYSGNSITLASPSNLRMISLGTNGNYSVVNVSVNGNDLTALLALTSQQRTKGMTVFDHIDNETAMLFVFDKTQTSLPFWTKDVKFPIDLFWLDENNKVVHIEKSVEPCHSFNDCQLYQPDVNFKYVLGTARGFADKNSVEVGTRANFAIPFGIAAQPLPSPTISINSDINELRLYALKKINEDRARYNLLPVALDDNKASQAHAEEMVLTQTLSHWTTDGMKPYMRYSVYGGKYIVEQNAAISFLQGSDAVSQLQMKACEQGYALCQETVDPHASIDKLEDAMMNNDLACCNNGHRDNILDRDHTHVSIGISYSADTFAMIQNFENQYIDWSSPITYDPTSDYVSMSGTDIQNKQISSIAVYYDPLPTAQTYLDNKNTTHYDLGTFAGLVEEPLPPGFHYVQNSTYTQIIAHKWNASSDSFDIGFSLARFTERHGTGVYTLVLEAEDKDNTFIPLTSKSLFKTS